MRHPIEPFEQPRGEGVLRGARIVLEDEIVDGAIRWRDGRVTDIDAGPSTVGEDVGGDFVLPGLVELHTDHLETHYAPRPSVRWNMVSAIQAHDAQVATAGITTVLDCLRLGTVDGDGDGFEAEEMQRLSHALARAADEGRLRAEHLLHLRCEVSAADVIEGFAPFADDPRVRLLSLMDHAPGQRQFASLEAYARHRGSAPDDARFAAFVAGRQADSERFAEAHRRALAERARERGITLASHDDADARHVAEARAHGVAIAEFPTTLEAARAAREAGLAILMGAPNVVRGRSHSGNVAAGELAAAGLLDLLSSDYVPASLLQAAFVIAHASERHTLPAAIALVSAVPARSVGLEDRGRLAPGLRADLLRVGNGRAADDVPTVRAVWREGRRVA